MHLAGNTFVRGALHVHCQSAGSSDHRWRATGEWPIEPLRHSRSATLVVVFGNNGPRANRRSHVIPRARSGMTALPFGQRTCRHRSRGTAERFRRHHTEARKKLHDGTVEIGWWRIAVARASASSHFASLATSIRRVGIRLP